MNINTDCRKISWNKPRIRVLTIKKTLSGQRADTMEDLTYTNTLS